MARKLKITENDLPYYTLPSSILIVRGAVAGAFRNFAAIIPRARCGRPASHAISKPEAIARPCPLRLCS